MKQMINGEVVELGSKVVRNECILGGTPVLSGTRIPADNVLAEIREGSSRFKIFRHSPGLSLDGIEVVFAWEKAGRPI
jgi:uncharacterized protein (DUF433 family)